MAGDGAGACADAHQRTAKGRFNAGQKLNFLLVCLLLGALYISGVDTIVVGTKHNLIFAVHKLATIAASILVAGHIYMAAFNRGTRDALRGMLTGEADREWAQAHYPRWTLAQPVPGADSTPRDRPSRPLGE